MTISRLDRSSIPPAPRRGRALLAGAIGAAIVSAGVAAAQEGGTGGVYIAGPPQINDVRCVSNCIQPRKGVVTSKFLVMGKDLRQVKVVSLPRADGTRAKDTNFRVKPSGNLVAVARKGAITGPVRVANGPETMVESGTPFRIGTMAELRKSQRGWRFPVRGSHTFGGPQARFGAPRSGHRHQGHDVFAKCGTKMVAARGGWVRARGYHAAAGHYLVIKGFKSPYDFVYMHLTRPALVRKGARIATGRMIGRVGQTGNASGCHLHFEIWTKPGWYNGGRPINPLPHLKRWKRWNRASAS